MDVPFSGLPTRVSVMLGASARAAPAGSAVAIAVTDATVAPVRNRARNRVRRRRRRTRRQRTGAPGAISRVPGSDGERTRSGRPYDCAMKYVVLVPDGCADEPLAELGDRTPLEAARMPHLAALAARGEVGRANVIPAGLPPGSDVGNLAILGFDPAQYHTGRAPIEAAAMGVELAPDEVAYRCNLVTVSDDDPPVMVDFAAGHITSEQSHPIVAALDDALGNGRDGVRRTP